MADDQFTKTDPTEQFRVGDFPPDSIAHPGLTDKMSTRPDHGEQSYRGSFRLTGKRALVTGGDSGIGRATAIAFAREGADVALAYLPSEEDDARETAGWVTKAGRRAATFPMDLQEEEQCNALIARTVDQLGG